MAAEVSVDGFEAVVVADDYVVSVAAGFIFGETHFAVECGADGVADRQAEIGAAVHAPELRAPAVG